MKTKTYYAQVSVNALKNAIEELDQNLQLEKINRATQTKYFNQLDYRRIGAKSPLRKVDSEATEMLAFINPDVIMPILPLEYSDSPGEAVLYGARAVGKWNHPFGIVPDLPVYLNYLDSLGSRKCVSYRQGYIGPMRLMRDYGFKEIPDGGSASEETAKNAYIQDLVNDLKNVIAAQKIAKYMTENWPEVMERIYAIEKGNLDQPL
jgi:hypothetical protein